REAGEPGGAAMRVRNSALGKALGSTVGDKRVALMRGHGNVVVGPDVQMAVRYAIYTEVNARLQAAAIAIGGPINYISAEEGAARDRAPTDFARAWELWKKKTLGKEPQRRLSEQWRKAVAQHDVVAGDHAALERDALALAPHLRADGVAGKNRPREPRLDAFEPLRPVVGTLAQDRARRDAEASRTMQDGTIEARGLGAL